MLYGTAMHDVIQDITKIHTQTGTIPNATEIKTLLEKALLRLPLSAEEYSRLHEKGYNALLLYVESVGNILPKKTQEEFSLRVVLETGIAEFPELLLTGKLDRLDFDEKGAVVKIIDYKTGKPKTRNDIEGKTKSSNGDYKRQLVF